MANIQFSCPNFGRFSLDLNETETWGHGFTDHPTKLTAYSWVSVPSKIQRSPGQERPSSAAQLLSLSGTVYLKRSPDVIAGWLTELRPEALSIVDTPHGFEIQFPLVASQIEAIEAYRDTKDLSVELDITCTVALNTAQGVDKIENCWAHGALRIARSRWTDYVLPYLSYHAIKVVELPIPEEPVGELFLKAWVAFRNAEAQYPKDYVTCVEEARKVLQPIIDSVGGGDLSNTEKLRQYVNTNLKPLIGPSWADSVGKALVALWNMTSKHHHASPYTLRHDAALTLHLSSALISYLAHVIETKDRKGTNE